MSVQKKSTALFLLLAGVVFCGQTKPAGSTYTDSNYHFSIANPDFPAATAPAAPVMFVGPAENAFAPNVNVMVIPGKTTRKDFLDQTTAQVASLKAKINSQKELQVSGRDAEMLDYSANMAGKDLRFLALFVVDADKVYLVTCTALAGDFAAQEARFKACVESFKLTGK